MKINMTITVALLALGVSGFSSAVLAASTPPGVQFPGPEPGAAKSSQAGQTFTLENKVISMTWAVNGNTLTPVSLANKLTGQQFDQRGCPLFQLTEGTGTPVAGDATNNTASATTLLSSDTFHFESAPKLVTVASDRAGVRLADRMAGKALECTLVSDQGVRVKWRAELRNGGNYIHESAGLEPLDSARTFSLRGGELLALRLPAAQTCGVTAGCPVVGDGFFAGVELPGSKNTIDKDDVRIGFPCNLWLTGTQTYSFGAVIGVAPEGQMRRAFLSYIERERARPSKPFLHYNCWYDLGFSASEKSMLNVVSQFDTELVKKRGVPVQSYLVDDGWDDPSVAPWMETADKFPHGFRGLGAEMAKVGAHLAIWISPMGGYGGAEERLKWMQDRKLVPANSPLDLSQPGYKQWFQDRCLQLMREDGVNAFKWDRAGEGVSPHFMALLDIAHVLHRENPAVFINVTVGTWPSPFWLNHVDSTWRNGSADVGWAGKGRNPDNKYNRERWLTFRDGSCRQFFVEKSPLYPLNSVMHHGIVYGRNFQGGDIGKSNPPDLKNEARSYFANGTSLQELYLTPSLLTPAAWDEVAAAAKWAQANADVLLDAHWVGGNPFKQQVYGYAAWSPRKGTLMLRNPDNQPESITLDADKVFELPAGAAKSYRLRSPYPDQRLQKLQLKAGQPQTITLNAFEVLVFDALP